MRHSILIFILVIVFYPSFGQNSNTWAAFWNSDTTLIGFKDNEGIVKIQPRFMGLTFARKFDDIIAVTHEVNGKWENYYLTKSGRIIGRDSLHIFDNGADCESEGFIRFRDHKTDKAGMFNKSGDVVIPAEYNDLSRVKNGMVIALKGATKKYSKGKEHYSLTGGKQLLIDTNNNILIDNFNQDYDLNFFSLTISNLPNPDTLRQNFIATNNQYYSFIDFDKEFKVWLKTNLLSNVTKEKLIDVTYDTITLWQEPNGWVNEPKRAFIERNFELIKSKLLELNSSKCQYSIFSDGLNPYIYTSDGFEVFYNNCREPKDWMYPVKIIAITHKNKKDFQQDHLSFLRTDNGYKLINLVIRSGKVK